MRICLTHIGTKVAQLNINRLKCLRANLFYPLLLSSILTSCIGSPVSVSLKVIDDDFRPVNWAHVRYNFYSVADTTLHGITSFGGRDFKVWTSTVGVGYRVVKEGYYDTGGRLGYGSHDLTVVLREKKNPIPMYAKKLVFPKTDGTNDTWIGYDFFAGEFVPPYGNGETADIEIRRKYLYKDLSNYKADMEVRFPNDGDGIVKFEIPKHRYASKFRSDYNAPAEGYINELRFYSYRSEGHPHYTNYERGANYYFRIRTEFDHQGDVISAYYGKIYGELNSHDKIAYLNPTPNDRNVEFDPLWNLFMFLEKDEKVWTP